MDNSETAGADFKRSLGTSGAVVVYFGHTVLSPTTTLGLTPRDPAIKKPAISCGQLSKLLSTAKAKIVVLAGCAISHCIRKIKGDTIVIVIQSGKDRLTNALIWAPAIKALLHALLARGTAGDALAAANHEFKRQNSRDRFKMINGDPTVRLKPGESR